VGGDADRVLQERDKRAAHHAACVMDLADEASEVLNGRSVVQTRLHGVS
jgi:hypothetical protein